MVSTVPTSRERQWVEMAANITVRRRKHMYVPTLQHLLSLGSRGLVRVRYN